MPDGLTRRELLMLMLAGCAVEANYRNSRLGARPKRNVGTGFSPSRVEEGPNFLAIYRPTSLKTPAPLILALHGAGGRGERFIRRFTAHADRLGAIVVAPDSRGQTWDFQNDAGIIDKVLSGIFDEHAIDRAHLGVAGYSDGASYALTLGLTNGDLFSHVIAYSPGFLKLRTASEDKPRVFLSHGTRDEILPIERCGRVIAASLERHDYKLTYREFDGTHALPDDIVTEGVNWFAG